jgi:hypothetical protein
MGNKMPVLSLLFLLFYAVGAFAFSLISPALIWYLGVAGLGLSMYSATGASFQGEFKGRSGKPSMQPQQGNPLNLFSIWLTLLIALFGLVVNVFVAIFICGYFSISQAEIMFKVFLPFDVQGAQSTWLLITSFLGGLLSVAATVGLILLSQFFIAVSETLGFQGPLLILLFVVVLAATKNVFAATIISAAISAPIFAYFHFLIPGTAFSALRLALLTANAVVWGIMTLLTKSIWPAVFNHMLWNIIAFMSGAFILAGLLQLVVVSYQVVRLIT